MKIGVLAMQGAYREHLQMLKALGVEAIDVRYEEDIDNIDGLIIPGGESTTMGKLIKTLGLYNKLKSRIENGMPVWGTCAGMILLAKNIVNENYNHLAVMDINVRRNAYGRQLGSFETKALVKGIGDNIEMVFIRAPYIESVGENIEILSTVDGNIVAAQEENMLVTSFHPELTEDLRMHKYFVDIVAKSIK
ncbi:MAG: pyridoxal 5'-phosphate synthase glutaminase subunit PdxT [Intestinibacter sp.]|uniref:pyridoxal 5'-phosphate synthase glutaminase subunit PdxT n=1 Tax=Intestinibacter sp. TaxID=1965304 RepID=UPI003F167823